MRKFSPEELPRKSAGPELVAPSSWPDTGRMSIKHEETETLAIQTAKLSLRFPRCGDRYRLQAVIGEELLLETIDGSDEDAWPASPPLQQLHQQQLPSGAAVFGVGAAGTTHWSASFSIREPGLVWLEYAARVRREWNRSGEWLGGRFRLAPGWEIKPEGAAWSFLGNGHRAQLLPLGAESVLELNGFGEFVVRPATETPGRANTIEWKFALSLGE